MTVPAPDHAGRASRSAPPDRRDPAVLRPRIDAAVRRIAPLWPLESFVAVNPYHGLEDRPFWDADALLRRLAGTGLCMPRRYYRAQMACGRITDRDVREALDELGLDGDVALVKEALAGDEGPPTRSVHLVTDLLDATSGKDWSGFVVEQISHYCAAYFDEGQSLWPLPWKGGPFFDGWREYTCLDKSPRVFGMPGLSGILRAMPDTPDGAVAWALDTLELPSSLVDDYLHAALLSVGGWAAWARYRLWQAELAGGDDDALRGLLAARLAWDALLHRTRPDALFRARWRTAIEAAERVSSEPERRDVERVSQTALEIGYRRRLVDALASGTATATEPPPPRAQAVFCIDVRSEVFRRALETVAPEIQTLGFPGFFGIAKEYRALGDTTARRHLPVFLTPVCRVSDHLPERPPDATDALARRRQERRRLAKAWKAFRVSAAACFSFVEVAGLLYAPKILADALGWTRPVPAPDRAGLFPSEARALRLRLRATGTASASSPPPPDLTPGERVDLAASALRAMSFTQGFAPIVLLVGHGSAVVNNPQAAALDCGACGGYSGEVSARAAASLLNDARTRAGLRSRGIEIPDATLFVPALHDTVTDSVRILERESVPVTRRAELRTVETWLEEAARLASEERAARFGTPVSGTGRAQRAARRRSRDWAETRPEWAQAQNAAFVAAPRRRTRGRGLDGRVFLHEYDWREDTDGSVLELILTAPVRVALWINLQYYGSMVDNRRFGSGNKVLHNVVGGALGVLEGNGGDLRVGLALQSLHDGERWVHEPVRLNVVVEAPEERLERILAARADVRQWVDHEWLFLYRFNECGLVTRRLPGGGWKPVSGVS